MAEVPGNRIGSGEVYCTCLFDSFLAATTYPTDKVERTDRELHRDDALPCGSETARGSGLGVRGKARRLPSHRRSDENRCRALVAKQKGLLAPSPEGCARSGSA